MSPGESVGPYQIVRRIGSGGMAEVYEALRPGLEGFRSRVALKCLHHSEDDRFIQLFINEARLGSQLHHINIVSIQDFNRAGDLYYIVMELVDGVDLQTVLSTLKANQRQLEPALAVMIIQQVLAGLSYAHRAIDEQGQAIGLIHRDIKPANIILSYEGMAKILDFGVAKALTSAFRTQEAVPRGTLAYMSPEQVAGERHLTPASDLFGVGAMLFEMLMQVSLYNEDSYPRFLMAVGEADVREQLKAFRSRFPMLYEPLRRALEKDAHKRFQTADEFSVALQAVLPRLGMAPTIPELLESLPLKSNGLRHRTHASPLASPHSASLSRPNNQAHAGVPWWKISLAGAGSALFALSGLMWMFSVSRQEVTLPTREVENHAAPSSTVDKGTVQNTTDVSAPGRTGAASTGTTGNQGGAATPSAGSASNTTSPAGAHNTAGAPQTAHGTGSKTSPEKESGSEKKPTPDKKPPKNIPTSPLTSAEDPRAQVAARPAEKGEGFLELATVPPDADVYEGGVRACEVPCRLKLDAGSHALEFRSHDGHHRKRFDIVVEPDRVRKLVWDFQQNDWLAR